MTRGLPSRAWRLSIQHSAPGSDDCPDQPETLNGYRDDDGCPDEKPKEAVLEEKSIAIPQLFFYFDKTELKPESQKVIKDVAKILKGPPRKSRRSESKGIQTVRVKPSTTRTCRTAGQRPS